MSVWAKEVESGNSSCKMFYGYLLTIIPVMYSFTFGSE